ncbi:hypothetical protein Tco_0715314 [Tanacetum coccineum]
MRPADQPVNVRSPSVDCLTETIVNDQVKSSSFSNDKCVSSFELTVVGEGCSDQSVIIVEGSKNRRFLTKALEEEAIVMKPVSKKKKSKDPRRMSVRGNVCPLPTAAVKGIGKHPRLLARYIGNLARSSDSLALRNILSNESRVMSQDHLKLKNNLVSLKSKKSLLEHEMSKLEDQNIKAQKSQDFEGWLLPRGVKETNFIGVEWFATPFEGG